MYECISGIKPQIEQAIQLLNECYRNGGKILVCGNGGSCADADHIITELAKGFKLKRPVDANLPFSARLQGGMPAINLGAHSALMTAIINDLGADVMFAQQVWVYGNPGDVLIGISTSGSAENVLNSAAAAKARGMKTILFTGAHDGMNNGKFDILIKAPSTVTSEIQDIHSAVYHMICAEWEATNWSE